MPRKGENIYKRKDGRWEGRYIKGRNVEGKTLYGYVYGKTYASAKEQLRDRQIKQSVNNTVSSQFSASYSEILSSWLEAQRINVKESSYARYHQVIYTHINPSLGKLKINNINAQIVEKYIIQLMESGRLDGNGGLSAKTVSDILTIIKATVQYAKYNNYVVGCNLDKIIIKRQKEEIRVLTIAEQQKLMAILLEDTDLIKFGVILSLYTGVRIGELCALKWENINVTDGVLSVKKTMQRIKDTSNRSSAKTKIIITEPKSKTSVRDIPLPPFVAELAARFQNSENKYILTGDHTRFIEPRTMQNKFKSIIKESNIDETNFHVLRHTFATRCIEAGFEIKTLSEILGHSNVNITLNRYVHSSFDLKRENMGKLCCISQL